MVPQTPFEPSLKVVSSSYYYHIVLIYKLHKPSVNLTNPNKNYICTYLFSALCIILKGCPTKKKRRKKIGPNCKRPKNPINFGVFLWC